MTETENFKEFEQSVKKALENEGWQVTAPPDNNLGHELEAVKGNTRAAVQVKNYKKAATVAHLQQFIDFLDLSMAGRFNQAHFISASGFSTSAVALAGQRNDPRLRLGTLRKGKLSWLGIEETESLFEQPMNVAQTDGKTYIGVFTCKGGVGKTTVSAHLAGAFALTGYDVA